MERLSLDIIRQNDAICVERFAKRRWNALLGHGQAYPRGDSCLLVNGPQIKRLACAAFTVPLTDEVLEGKAVLFWKHQFRIQNVEMPSASVEFKKPRHHRCHRCPTSLRRPQVLVYFADRLVTIADSMLEHPFDAFRPLDDDLNDEIWGDGSRQGLMSKKGGNCSLLSAESEFRPLSRIAASRRLLLNLPLRFENRDYSNKFVEDVLTAKISLDQ